MKHLLLPGVLLLFSTAAFADTCLPGSLLDYINLGVDGCTQNGVQFFDFFLGPLQNGATEIDPSSVLFTPSGGPSTPGFSLALNSNAAAGQLLESSFHFSASGDALMGASISLGSPAVTGDGAVTGVLDVCADGNFLGIEPIGCSGTALNTIVFAIEGDSFLADSITSPISSFFDVFTDLTIDGGTFGSASLDSATVSVTTPEPSSLLLMTGVLGSLAILKARRGRRS